MSIVPEILLRPLADLEPSPTNPRTHSAEQVAQIAASMREFGFVGAILADAQGIVAGHGRSMGAALIYADGGTLRFPSGIEIPPGTVPVLDCTGWTPAQRRAYIIADNQLAQNAGWDEALLKAELAALDALDFDMALIGFDSDEMERLLSFDIDDAGEDEAPEPPEDPVSRLGDIWLMGEHRVMCGSSTNAEHIAAVVAGRLIDIVCSDPPYGISVVKNSSVGGAKPFGSGNVHSAGPDGFKRGRVHGPAKRAIIKPGTYAPIIGDDSTETAVAHYHIMAQLQIPAIVLWGGNYFANDLPPSRCWLVWDKQNSGSFADVELAWTNQDKVAKLFTHQWNGMIKASERGERRVHPTQKPVALAEWVVSTIAPEAKVLFDGFLGSAWTLIAAERMRIACIAMELAPAYVDVAVLRWETYAGGIATLEATGQTFAEVMAERLEG